MKMRVRKNKWLLYVAIGMHATLLTSASKPSSAAAKVVSPVQPSVSAAPTIGGTLTLKALGGSPSLSVTAGWASREELANTLAPYQDVATDFVLSVLQNCARRVWSESKPYVMYAGVALITYYVFHYWIKGELLNYYNRKLSARNGTLEALKFRDFEQRKSSQLRGMAEVRRAKRSNSAPNVSSVLLDNQQGEQLSDGEKRGVDSDNGARVRSSSWCSIL